jgi:hypothetical protein
MDLPPAAAVLLEDPLKMITDGLHQVPCLLVCWVVVLSGTPIEIGMGNLEPYNHR